MAKFIRMRRWLIKSVMIGVYQNHITFPLLVIQSIGKHLVEIGLRLFKTVLSAIYYLPFNITGNN